MKNMSAKMTLIATAVAICISPKAKSQAQDSLETKSDLRSLTLSFLRIQAPYGSASLRNGCFLRTKRQI